MSSTGSGQPPAGWYPDPRNPAVQRFWDGAQWTEHRAPVPAAEEEPPPPPAVPPSPPPAAAGPPPGGGSPPRLPWILAAAALAVFVVLAVVVVILLVRRDSEPVASPSASPTASVEPSPSADRPSESPTATEDDSEQPSDTAEPADTVEPSGSSPPTYAFDERVRYDGGLTIVLQDAQLFTPSDTAAGFEPGQTAFRFTVAVENWSDVSWDPDGLTMLAGAGVDAADCSFVADVAQDLAGAPRDVVLPDTSVTFDWAFACDAGPGEPVIVLVRPGSVDRYAPYSVEGTLPE